MKQKKIRALMMSHMLITVDQDVHAADTVHSLSVDDYTHLGAGENPEQMSALNHNSLVKEVIE